MSPSVHDLKPFVFGGVASCVAEASTFPIDTAKTRLQLQRGAKRGAAGAGDALKAAGAGGEVPYRGMLDVWRRVAAEEGAAALYRGLSPALLRQASYGTIKFGLYHTAKEGIPLPESPAKNVVCAVASGAVASAIANPTDVLKVRLQARNALDLTAKRRNGAAASSPSTASMVACFADIYSREGPRGLWRGVAPTAQRAAVVAGVQLPVYDACKVFFLRRALLTDGAANHLVSSFCAGLCACLASCPVDVIRTRMMSQRKLKDPPGSKGSKRRFFLSAASRLSSFSPASSSSTSSLLQQAAAAAAPPGGTGAAAASPEPHVYRNSLQCAFATVRAEGLGALYKGFVPSFMRMGPWNIIFFLVYEELKREFPPVGSAGSRR